MLGLDEKLVELCFYRQKCGKKLGEKYVFDFKKSASYRTASIFRMFRIIFAKLF